MAVGTVQIRRSTWQWLDFYIFSALHVPQTGLVATDFTVRYKKNNQTVFTTKTLMTAISTTVAVGSTAGDTSVTVTDASVFPLSGSLRLDRGNPHDEILTYTAIPGSEVLTTSATAQDHAIGETVELVDFVEVGVGVYTFLFTPDELDTVGQFTIACTPNVGLQVVQDVDVIYSETLASVPPTSPTICKLYGYVIGQDGQPMENIGISGRLLALPSTLESSSAVVDREPTSARTDANGYFDIDLIQGSTVDVAIPDADYRRTIVVPSTDYADLFSIVAT